MNEHIENDSVSSPPPAPGPDYAGDPHLSRIDPDDPRLRIGQKKGRSLKKGPVIMLCCAVVFIIVFAFMFALLPSAMRSNSAAADKEEEQMTPDNANAVPDFIRNAPDNNDPVPLPAQEPPKPEEVPKLGGKLPGDLGNAMVEPAPQPNRPATGHVASSAPRQLSEAEKARLKALESDVFFKSSGSGSAGAAPPAQEHAMQSVDKIIDAYKNSLQGVSGAAAAPGGSRDSFFKGGGGGADQNQQGEKNAFIQGGGSRGDDYVKRGLVKPKSPYEIKAGTIIPVSLITGLNSDLPGEVIGQVRENVYDTVSGNYLLIPQGSRLMAAYDSVVSYGQNRVLVCWNRLIRPDGTSITMDCMPGVDLDGFSGFTGKVDNHYLRLVGGVLISSMLSATATKSQGNNVGGDNLTFDQIFASNVGSNINDVGQQITAKNLEVQPTIKVPAGDSVVVLVNKDMIIPPYETP